MPVSRNDLKNHPDAKTILVEVVDTSKKIKEADK